MKDVEVLLEKLIAEGKLKQEYVDEGIAALKAQQVPKAKEGDLVSLKNRQDETENTLIFILDLTLGGM